MVFVAGCDCPTVPNRLTSELPDPSSNRGLLLLIAEYEALRRRFNAGRAAMVEVLRKDESTE
ncbi:hypothetical protein R3F64_15690 [Halomonas sp. 5021]|jgi:molybdopterin-guanine dinucleotide biosynthesis protein A|uniref:hypothetical protein n=1 Tax=Halomonas sp. 5021 TaxID=3082156 RepID=UPI002FC656E9